MAPITCTVSSATPFEPLYEYMTRPAAVLAKATKYIQSTFSW
uniref:Uncharacterized protein n=1 Tax=Arundo donax TaxID=35708 RepID=A0A0A9H7I4_ARUDO